MTLGWIGEADEEIPEVKEMPTLPGAAAEKPTPVAAAKTRPQRAAAGGRLRASPAARKLAAENGMIWLKSPAAVPAAPSRPGTWNGLLKPQRQT